MRLIVPGRNNDFVKRCAGFAAIVVMLFMTTSAVAQFAEPVTWIEEDWQLELLEPGGDVYAPQLHTCMAASSDPNAFYAQVTWNYWEYPDFHPGGFQVQGWKSGEVVKLKSIGSNKFSTSSELVTWTQIMAQNGAETWFAVINGNSLTWGAFGGVGTVIGGFVGISDLSGYSPDLSVSKSWVTYGANRVVSLKIVEVRYYGDSESGVPLYTDNTARVVYPTE